MCLCVYVCLTTVTDARVPYCNNVIMLWEDPQTADTDVFTRIVWLSEWIILKSRKLHLIGCFSYEYIFWVRILQLKMRWTLVDTRYGFTDFHGVQKCTRVWVRVWVCFESGRVLKGVVSNVGGFKRGVGGVSASRIFSTIDMIFHYYDHCGLHTWEAIDRRSLSANSFGSFQYV